MSDEILGDEPPPEPTAPPSPRDREAPKTGRLLALDHGKVRVGVAVSDTGQEYAGALETYVRVDPGADAAYFKTLKKEYDPVGVVVGLPLHFGGEESGSSGGAGPSGSGSAAC